MRQPLAIVSLSVSLLALLASPSQAAIHELTSPGDVRNASTINFEGYLDSTIANSLYQGVTFSRDDGAPVYITAWSASGRDTTSPGSVLSTIAGPTDSSWTSQLNISLESPVHQFGVYFGNDQTLPMFPAGDFSTLRLSAFSPSGQFLGSVSLAANHNTSVDQFIGIDSDIPIADLRLENLSSSGAASQFYAVAVDDMMFSHVSNPLFVPEPSTACLMSLGVLGFAVNRRKSRKA